MGSPTPVPAGSWAYWTASAIRVMRNQSGLTIKEIAERAGLSDAYLYARSNCRHPYSLSDIEAVAQVMDVTPVDIAVTATTLADLSREGMTKKAQNA